jgi:beta-glucosidase
MLKAFDRVELAPGQTRIVRLAIDPDELRWRDPLTGDWRLEPGEYAIHVGGGLADLRLSAKLWL